tara:strand:- start:1961 stop:2968 length:1008 start_codon:yes stop_codon:yes gene_type:complete
MANVQIADIYNPLVFSAAEQEAQIELNAFLASGVMVEDPRLTAMASTGGNIGELPFFKPLGTEEPNYSNDVTGDTSTPNKITTAIMKYRLASQNQSWSTMDLAVDLALADPVSAITNRVGSYWATTNERRLIQSTMGILASNVANNSSDMVVSVATDSSSAVTDAELVSNDVILDAQQTAGDHQAGFSAIAMHSVVYSRLRKQQLIDFVRDADNNTLFSTYGNLRVIVDDSLSAVAGTNRVTYTTVIFGNGAVVSGMGRTSNPSELDRAPEKGNGGGQSDLYSRRADIIHPLGFEFTSASVAGQSATLAELATSANWSRVWERKNVPLCFLQTNG